MRFVAALIGLAIGFTEPILAQQKNTVDPQITQQIRVLAMKCDEAFNRSEATAVAALYTKDAIYVAQHGTSHGRQAIEKTYASYFQRWHSINQVSTVDRVEAPHSAFAG